MQIMVESRTQTAKDDTEKKESLWSSILNEVQSHASKKLPSCKSVLVLGNNESGKTTLVAKLQGAEDPKKGAGLEYAYIDVRDEYRDEHTRLSVWVLDGDARHTNLLKFALNEETFEHTLIMLVVSMTTPWSIMEQLQEWISVLGDHVDSLPIDTELRRRCRDRIVRMWMEYTEPAADEGEPGAVASPMKRSSAEIESDGLPDGVLNTNLGLDLVVVVTKTDYITTLEKEMDYRDEHLDFMQQWIRRFCLQHGAALFYTSAKEDKNCDLLYRYLVHRVYGLPFRTPALVVEKDAVFVPSGWDNAGKIAILHEGLHSCRPDDYYKDVIQPPAAKKAQTRSDTELIAEDEQVFLARQLQTLLAGAGKDQQQTAGAKLATPRLSAGSGTSPASKKLDSSKVVSSAAGEGVLANFFNSLLTKKPGTPGKDISSSPEKIATRSDAAAELDRLARGKTSPDSSEC